MMTSAACTVPPPPTPSITSKHAAAPVLEVLMRSSPICSLSWKICQLSASRRLEPALANQRLVLRRAHELRHRSSHLAFLRDRQHADREMIVLLQLRRERAGQLRAFDRQDHVDLLHRDLDLAAGHGLGGREAVEE